MKSPHEKVLKGKKDPSPLRVEKKSGNVCRFGHCTFAPDSKGNGYCTNHKK